MFTRLIELKPRQILLLKGPAEITGHGDGLTALGKPLRKGESTRIRRDKIMPFEADRETMARITLRGGADYLIRTGRFGISIWRSVADRVFAPDADCRRVMIVGATDAGKSTLSTYLLNTALWSGRAAGVIDEDVGQGDLAPPGCVGGAVLRRSVFDLRDLEADFFGFVGAISPRGVEGVVRKAVCGIGRRLDALSVDFTVVNTDGYVASEGVFFKVGLIRSIDPDVVVCFENPDEGKVLYERLREVCDCPLVLAERPAYSVKSVSERVRRRMSQYRRFLKGGRRFRVDLRGLGLWFMGRAYRRHAAADRGSGVVKIGSDGGRLIIRPRSSDDLVVISGGGNVVLPFSSLEDMFVGLGSVDSVSRFGRCVRVYPDFTADLLTDSLSGVDTVFFSLIRLRHGLRREEVLPVVKPPR